jgi:lipid II:glycine glycyltransferase (peptidoglycan interpeptide bridge formation enzyme)
MNAGLPGKNWDQKLVKLGGHVLQSSAWLRFQQALDREVFWDEGQDWMWSASLVYGRGVKYLQLPYGPTVMSGWPQAAASVSQTGQQLGVDFARTEPIGKISRAQIKAAGAKKFAEVQPEYTWVVDLTQTAEALKSQLSSGNRNLVNTADKKGLSFRKSTDLEPFLKMLEETAKHGKFVARPNSYYQKMWEVLSASDNAQLYYAEADGSPVAGSVVLDFGATRYYYLAAADQEKSRQLRAPGPLVWHMMMDAKAAGRERFDFWGVAPPDQPNHAWAGLSQFKKSFGGEQVQLNGTWDIVIKPAKYRLYRVAKKVLPL